MRGPLLSGPLGSAATLAAVARWLRPHGPMVALGPSWLGATLSAELPVLALVGPDERDVARKAQRRAAREARRFQAAFGGSSLPLRPGGVGAILVEGLCDLGHEESARYVVELVRALRPGGRLVALDATREREAEARLGGVFLAAALVDLAQEIPREGVVMTVGAAPSAAVMRARLAGPAAPPAGGPASPGDGST